MSPMMQTYISPFIISHLIACNELESNEFLTSIYDHILKSPLLFFSWVPYSSSENTASSSKPLSAKVEEKKKKTEMS